MPDGFVPNAVAIDARSTLSDAQVVERVRAGERALFEILMRRHNQKLYRVVRAILKDEHEVEDVMQQAYVNAFVHLHQFEERSQFSTWLTRIALNEAFGRRRRMRLVDSIPADKDGRAESHAIASTQPDPERQAYTPGASRSPGTRDRRAARRVSARVHAARGRGAQHERDRRGPGLGLEVIKTRLHRARAMLQRAVTARLGDVAPGVFRFHAPRCDRVVSGVFSRIAFVSAASR